MIYHIQYDNQTIEFTRNEGRCRIKASNSLEAVDRLRKLFPNFRNEVVAEESNGSYLIQFRVGLDYRLPILRSIEKSMKLLGTEARYDKGRYIDRYIVVHVFKETGQPVYLSRRDIKEEISMLRQAAVVARELPNELNFVDYDICIYNYLELNSKQGYRSRVIRQIND